MEILNSLWDNESEDMRHIINGLNPNKQKTHINNFKDYYIKHINTNQIKKSVDWGCGGGLLTKELKKFSDEVYCVDVSKKSLNSCIEYASPTKTYLLKDDPITLNLPQVDFILANAIVWHFPSLDYFKSVVKKWGELNPKFIAFNTKKSDVTKETSNYKQDIIKSLLLNDNDVIELLNLNGYKLINKELSKNTVVPSTYFVFNKK